MAHYATHRRPPRTLTKTEQATLLKITGEHARGYRDHMLFALALGTGLRESELLALDVGDVAHRAKVRRRIVLRVFKRCTETPSPQEVFLPDSLIHKLDRFLKWKMANGKSVAADAPLFVSRNGNRLSTRRARAAFQLWQERCALPRTLSFHSLRPLCRARH